MKSLTELLQPLTADQWKDTIFSKLAGKGFPTSDWHSGSEERTVVEAEAYALAVASAQVPAVAASGFVGLATGDFLDWAAYSQYDEKRKPAVQARIYATLTAAPGRGPYEMRPGDIWAATPEGLRFNSVTGGVLPLGGTLRVTMAAEGYGGLYNIAPNTLTVLQTPFPGVTINNDGSIETAGVDAESDAAFSQRAKLKWASIGYGGSSDAYKFHALTARDAVTKVRVLDQHPRGQGTVDVVLWGEGGLSSDDIAAVDAVIQLKRSNTANVLVYSATPVVIPITGTIYVRAGQKAAAQAAAVLTLKALENAIEIGGIIYDSDVIKALRVPGVIDTDLTSPLDDLQLGPIQAAVLALTADWVEI